MKKILVVDESRAVRETLALILSRDFIVTQRPHLEKESLTHQNGEADLLIFGVSASLGEQPAILLKIASQALLPVLFLIDSRSLAQIQPGQEKMDYLAKPFNPYELREKVVRLLGQDYARSESVPAPYFSPASKAAHYIEVPYVPASTSALAKRFAITALPVLIIAEMGSGQERVARAMHVLSGRAGRWIAIHPAELKRDDFFGQGLKKIDRDRRSNPEATIFLGGVESLDGLAQSSLLSFLEEGEELGWSFRILSSSCVDLLEKVYRGEFLAPLYYRLATLTLRIPPLRERRQDIPSLAVRLAQEFGKSLGIERVSFSTEATDRLSDYLWFGNLNEMETVIARTLATHRKPTINASDLVLGGAEGESFPFLAEKEADLRNLKDLSQVQLPSEKSETPVASKLGNGNFLHGGVLINELAHELKNPMVTIKTFVQLLGDRFDDAVFRNRFRETVAGDIERMDGLLESLLDFSRFTHLSNEKVFLYEELQRVVDELVSECKKKEVTVQWGRKGEHLEAFVDKDQLHYIVRNLLRAVLEQIQLKSEIQIDVKGERSIALTYVREGGRKSPLTNYLGLSPTMEEALPLRILLAKMLLERSGGALKVNYLEQGTVLIGIELPVS